MARHDPRSTPSAILSGSTSHGLVPISMNGYHAMAITDFPSREDLRQQLIAAGRDLDHGAAWLVIGGARSGKSVLLEMLHQHRDRRGRLPVRISASGGVMTVHQSALLDDIAELGLVIGRG